jgi:4-hydroxybenzoate polyprenyltransferase
LLELLHPGPALATTLAAVIFTFALGVPLSYIGFVITAVAVPMLLAQFSISALNDWADRERDAAAGRIRPIPLGLIPARVALGFAIACALLAPVVSVVAGDGAGATILLLLGIMAGWAYDLVFKPTRFSFLPFAFAFPLMLVWIGMIVGFGPPALLCFLAGVPLATAIHLADAIPDREADGMTGSPTLAVRLGARAESVTAVLLAIASVVLGLGSLRSRPGTAVLIVLFGLVASVTYKVLVQSRWIVAVAAIVLVLIWLRAGAW